MRSILILLIFGLIGCKDLSSQSILSKAEKSFEDLVTKNMKNEPDEATRFLDNEGKFILLNRKKFFEKENTPVLKELNLIEIFNPSMEKSYQAYIKKGSEVFSYESDIKYQSSFEVIDFEKFKRNNSLIACLLLKSENDIDKLIGEKDDSTFHFTVFITEVKKGKVTTYGAKNICTLD